MAPNQPMAETVSSERYEAGKAIMVRVQGLLGTVGAKVQAIQEVLSTNVS